MALSAICMTLVNTSNGCHSEVPSKTVLCSREDSADLNCHKYSIGPYNHFLSATQAYADATKNSHERCCDWRTRGCGVNNSRADTLSAFHHLGCMKLQWLRTRLRSQVTSRSFSTYPVPSLGNDLPTFQKQCFQPEQPAILPGVFNNLPAMKHWFSPGLNTDYLRKHGGDAFVPLELTQSTPEGPSFRSFHAPLSLFLDWMESPTPSKLYLAQCQLLDLPPLLRADFPTPTLVSQAGRGDIYDTNVWIGHPPTYTPLHRDPNPNLFVQLAGEKVVRLLAPDEGHAVFAGVRARLGKSGDRGAAAFRGRK
ncbi:unnamed protein product [Penicillium salamii]|nr:unnamed protein product [Penicillium salamii]